jgi:hypothetical protein
MSPCGIARTTAWRYDRPMGNLLGAIIKDFLKGFLFWAVASVLLIYFFKYPGMILSGLLGLIFLASFCAMWGSQLLFWLVNLIRFGGGGGRPDPPPRGTGQGPSPGSVPNTAGDRTCSSCGGSGSLTCYRCNGSGWLPEGDRQVTCRVCAGLRTIRCSDCSGRGRVNW